MIFSISDLDAEQDVPEAFQDEEAADAGSGGLGDEAAGSSESSFPVETSITVTKQSGGAMTIDAVAQGESWPSHLGAPRVKADPHNYLRRPLHHQQHCLLPGRGHGARHDLGGRLEAPGTVHGPGSACFLSSPLGLPSSD